MINPLRDSKVRTKISFLVLLTLVLISVVVGFGLRQINVIGKEMSAVVEGDVPLLKALNRLTFHKLQQTIHLEKAIQSGRSMGEEGALKRDFSKARGDFFDHGRLVIREIEQGRLLIKRVYAKYRGHEMEDALLQIDYELRSVQKEFTDYQFRAERTFNLLAQGKLKEAEPAIQEIAREREFDETLSQENYGYLENFLALIENFISESTLQAKRNERNAMIGMVTISALILLLSLGWGIAISRSITKPLHAAVKVANQIAAGDRAVTINAIAEDETGQLLKALKSMLCAIRDGETSLTQRAEELSVAREESLTMMENIQVAKLRAEQANESLSQEIAERKKIEEDLKESEERYQNLVETANVGIISAENGVITQVNKKAEEIYGYTREELVGQPPGILASKRYMKQHKEILEKMLSSVQIEQLSFEEEGLKKDGSLFPVEMSFSLSKREDGFSVIAVTTDITERKEAEKEIKETKDFLANIFKTSADGIMLIDDKGSITMANDAVAKILGYSTRELAEKHAKDFVPEEEKHKEKGLEFFARLMEESVVTGCEFMWLRKDGSLIDVGISATLLKDAEGNMTGGVISARDITERKKVMDELEKTKDHLNNVIESSADSIIIGDPTGNIVKTNKAFLELLGFEEEEVVGKHIVELTVMEAGTYESTTGEFLEIGEEYFKSGQEMTEILFEKGRLASWENYYMRKDKKVVPVEMSIVFLFDKQGERTGSVGINRDITERKKMETQLKEATVQLVQSEKLSALGELTAGVAHELNQPLNGIKIISQSLLKDIERGQLEEEELGADLNDVVNQVNKMAEIIDHMRIFTRRSEGVPEERIDLNDIVTGAFKFLGQQLRNHNIDVQEELGSGLPEVVGDPIRLEQVFLNLVSNARNAVEGDEKEKKIIEVRTYAENINGDSSVVIEVKDNGGGVPENVRGKIFQPFFTTNAPGKGTGLGLSVSSKIIEEHQGRLEMDTTMGEGTTFRIILTAAE